MNRVPLCACVTLLLCCCHVQTMESRFFSDNPDAVERLNALKAYSLEDQYKIFRYGNDRIHPPAMLTEPIAARGATAVPFMLHQMELASDDESIADNFQVLEWMAFTGTYDVRSDPHAMKVIEAAYARLKDKNLCLEMLTNIKKSDCERKYNCKF